MKFRVFLLGLVKTVTVIFIVSFKYSSEKKFLAFD